MPKRSKKNQRDSGDGDGFSTANPFDALSLDLPAGPEDSTADAADDDADAYASLRGQALHVRREKAGRGGKTVTIIEDFPAAADTDALAALAKDLRQSLATGGTARPDHIELQGDHVPKTIAALKALGFQTKGG